MIKAYDVLGNIAIVNFKKTIKKSEKLKFAKKILKNNKSVRTVLEKTGKFKGRLRKMQTKHVFGEKTKEVLYHENDCVFRFNIANTYFSPRLSNERKEISLKIRKGDKVLVMFAGVAPYSIVIAKNSGAEKVYSNELNRQANKYAEMNIELNNLKRRVELLPGDIKRVAEKLKKVKTRFDVIVMPRPQLKDSFLKQAFMLAKKGTRIFYYDFCNVNETKLIVDKIKLEAQNARKKVRILKIKKAGETAPYEIRVRVDFVIV